MTSISDTNDFEAGTFFLYDLKVEVIAPEGSKIWCNAKVGDYFEVKGELLHFREDMPFSLYNLAALLPLLPAKQRQVDKNDWMFTDTDIACTDPNCPTRFRITRTGLRKFRHDDTTAVSQSFSTLD
ncbi:TIGR04076 family protein [Acetobacter persici]|nr:TIGR04076 family protein [Acetobacter persici]